MFEEMRKEKRWECDYEDEVEDLVCAGRKDQEF